MNIRFEKASLKFKDAIFRWLEEPHVKEFWDYSQAHKNDILIFMNGRKELSSYFNGLFMYWVGIIDDDPFCLILTLQEKAEYNLPTLKKAHLSSSGSTYSMDYMIGKKRYFGKGIGAKTLEAFIDFFRQNYNPTADTFFIDPDATNTRARHVYEKAGFIYIGDFIIGGDSFFAGKQTHFLVKKLAWR